MRLANPSSGTVHVQARFLGEDGAASLEAAAVELAPGQVKAFRNVLLELWNSEESAGAIEVDSDGPVVIAARNYTDRQEKVFGVSVPAVARRSLLTSGRTGDLPWLAQGSSGSVNLSTDVWLYLDNAAAEAEVEFFNEKGESLALGSYGGGGARVVRIRVGDVVPGDVPLLRAEVRAKSGGVAAFAELSSSSGDRMGNGLVDVAENEPTQVLSAAYRIRTSGGTALWSDVRLFNPRSAEITMRLIYRGESKTVTLGPKELREIPDVLGMLYGAVEDSQDLLFIALNQGVAMARTAAGEQFGEMLAGALHQPENIFALGVAGEVSEIVDLPAGGAEILVATRAGGEAAAAEFSLADADGNDAGPGVKVVEVARQTTAVGRFADVFGVEPPATLVRLRLSPVSGQAQVSAVSLQSGSLDPSVHTAARAEQVGCARPLISRFGASSTQLAVAGEVTLDWVTEGAATVELTDGETGLAQAGSLVKTAPATTVYELRATNACGVQTAAVTVTVGAAKVVNATVGSGGETTVAGSPGELLTIRMENLGDPRAVDLLVFRAPDGKEIPGPVMNVSAAGTVYARVPYWVDQTTARGYRTGDVRVSVRLVDGARLGSAPLTITALSYPGDAVADFRKLIDGIAAVVKQGFEDARAQGGPVDALKAQETVAGGLEADLRKLANDVGSSGTGTLYYGFGNATKTDATSAVLTRQDLADVLALNLNAAAALAALNVVEGPLVRGAANGGSGGPREAGSCLQLKQPLIPICRAGQELQKGATAIGDLVTNFFTDEGIPDGDAKQVEDWVKKQLAKGAVGAAAKKIKQWQNIYALACLLYPIRLEGFEFQPRFIKHADYEYQATKTQLKAVMRPEKGQGDVAEYLRKRDGDALMNYFKLKGVSRVVAQRYIDAYQKASDYEFEQQLAALIRAFGQIQDVDRIQVGQCDILEVFPKLNGHGKPGNPNFGVNAASRLKFASSYPFGEDDYYFMGMRPGPETVCVVPNLAKFLLHDDEAKRLASNPAKMGACPYTTGVTTKRVGTGRSAEEAPPAPPASEVYGDLLDVGEAGKRATLFAEDVEASTDPVLHLTFLPPQTKDLAGGYSRTVSNGLATAKVVVTPTGGSSWKVTVNADGFDKSLGSDPKVGFERQWAVSNVVIELQNPENRKNTQRIRLQGAVTGNKNCVMGVGLTAGGKSAGSTTLGAGSYSLDVPGATSGTFSLSVTTSGDFAKDTANACSGTGTIELLEQ
jgi:hypothetical protein